MPRKSSKKVKVNSAFDLLGKSFEIVKNNWQLFLFVNIFAVIYAFLEALNPSDRDAENQTNAIMNGLSGFSGFHPSIIVGGGLLILLFAAINFLFIVMTISLETKSASGKIPDYNRLFNDGKKYFFPMLGLIIISVVITAIGLLLLIIPGIIAIGRLAMAPYVMIDKKVGIEEALRQSNQLGKKYFGEVWAAVLVMIVISIIAGILGKVPLLGPLAAVAITIAYSVVLALRYQQLN